MRVLVRDKLRYAVLPAFLLLCACQPQGAQPPAPASASASPFQLTASIKEIMASIVDPAADALWESVGSTITAKGTEDRRPHTDEAWQQLRRSALILVESTNLLMMEGRLVVPVGGRMADEGAEGVLTAAEAQLRITTQHATFVQMARALHDSAEQMLKAVDAKDAEELLEVGTALDEVCETCHTTFWYPNKK